MKLSQRLAQVDAPSGRLPRQRPLQARTSATRVRPLRRNDGVTSLTALKERVRSGVIEGLGPELVSSQVDDARVRRAIEGELEEALVGSPMSVPPGERAQFVDDLIADMIGW